MKQTISCCALLLVISLYCSGQQVEKMEVDGAIQIGEAVGSNPDAGTIRWNATSMDFEAYDGSVWKSMTSGNGSGSGAEGTDFGILNVTQKDQLSPSIFAAGDQFGHSMDIDGDYAIHGAFGNDINGSKSGIAFIFHWDGYHWIEQDTLWPGDPDGFDQFGTSVGISGDYAIVGANLSDDGASNAGSAYIFHRQGTQWTEQDKLLASDPVVNHSFGQSVDINGDYAIIGATGDNDGGSDSGSGYIFYRSGTDWNEQDKLTASNAESGDFLGYSVAIEGDYAIISAQTANSNTGSAYIFFRIGTDWNEQDILTASDAEEDDYFGTSVGISGDYAIVGAYGNDDDGAWSGSAYIFHRDNTDWNQQVKLMASDAAAADYFGNSVGISGDYAIVGAEGNDDEGDSSGAAYIFSRPDGDWMEILKLGAAGGADNDSFGSSVTIGDFFAMVGARFNDINGSNSGTVYVY